MTLRLAQDSEYLGNDWWSWSVCLEGTAAELDRVMRVVYFLHPTFPEPVREVTDRTSRFRLSTRGWGVFTIRAHVHRRNGSINKLSHALSLEYPPTPRRDQPARPGTRNPRTKADTSSATTPPNAAPPRRAVSSRPAPRKATSGPKVFVSYSVADARVAALVKNQLRAHGVEPLDPATLVAGSGSIDQAISSALASSDAVVSIVSDAASSWADAELGIARRKAVPILPIAVGIAGMPQGDIAAVQLSKSPTAREVKEKLRAALDKYLPNDFLG